MEPKLKENLDKALNSGKDALENLKEITKNITKEVLKKSETQGEDVKKSSGKLFKDIVNALGELGKDTFEYLKAATSGFKDGLKESSTDENNLLKGLQESLGESLKNIGEAGIYVTKETAKNLTNVVENLFKKNKDENNNTDSES